MGRLVISIDLDEWFHCRWVTGSSLSPWPDARTFLMANYGGERPRGDLVDPTLWLLDLFQGYHISATFFVLGEVVEWYPDLIKRIHHAGHEIACHGYYHQDATLLTADTFKDQLNRAKQNLEALTGEVVVGYRSPNLVLQSWMLPVLEESGFLYDSSVCPSHAFRGKMEGVLEAPINPYRLSDQHFGQEGNCRLVEIPLPNFPVIRLPAGSGIIMRLCGGWWVNVGLRNALKTGDSIFYLHPYELDSRPDLSCLPSLKERLYGRLFMRRTGLWMRNAFKHLVKTLDVEYIQARLIAHEFNEQ